MARSASISAFFEPGLSDWLLFTFIFLLPVLGRGQSTSIPYYDAIRQATRRLPTHVDRGVMCVVFGVGLTRSVKFDSRVLNGKLTAVSAPMRMIIFRPQV